MTDPLVEQRVDRLEDLMAALIRQAQRTDRQVERTSREMGAFKDEMGAFKDEMRTFKDEMRAFKDEMRAFKDEMRADRKAMNRKWGELANRLGTMAEDLVAPSIPRILRTVLGVSDADLESAVRVRRRSLSDRSLRREFDVVAVCGDYILINETKSHLGPEDVADFLEVLPTVRDYFPEQADKHVVGAIASLYVDPSVVRRGEAEGLIVLGFGEDVMDVLNSPGFEPREF
jgi:hypothetical protein